jgi:hypothetical protein
MTFFLIVKFRVMKRKKLLQRKERLFLLAVGENHLLMNVSNWLKAF